MRRLAFVLMLGLTTAACNCGSSVSRARSSLEVSPAAVDFGTVTVGASSVRSVTLSSRGNASVVLGELTLQGDAAFSLSPVLPRALASGETLELQLSYAPSSAGSHAARLLVRSDADNAPDLLVPLVGDASAGCQPTSCADQPKRCGRVPDGCGQMLDCGACALPETCGGAGTPNVCGCTPESSEALCARLAATCGEVTAVDTCGVTRTVSCGTCTLPQTCGGGGTANVCACSAETDTAFCSRLNARCGTVTATDACGMARTVNCGTCTLPQTCGGGGTPNVCACTPESNEALCTRLAATCGTLTAADNCGATRTVSCGTCTSPQTCGGGGTPNVCACAAETDIAFCSRLNARCGTVTAPDACGLARTVNCGTCTLPQTCGGGGAPNQCACTPESNQALCTRLAATCGTLTAADNCGATRTVSCGTCTSPQTCGGGGTPNVCACAAETDTTFCSRLNARCGTVTAPDTCGMSRTVSCGACTSPQTCGGGGSPNQCGCQETNAAFCSRLQKNCGDVTGTDACGVTRTVSCGSCGGTESCGGGGTANVCGCTAESNQSFCARGSGCGSLTQADNCGNQRTVDCGPCYTCSSPGVIPPLGHVVRGTTSGGSTLSSTCGGGSAPEQVWTYTPQASGSVTISSCGSSLDTVVSVRGESCGGAQLTCNDNTSTWCPSGTTHSYVTFNVTAGQTYYVVVDGSGSSSGSYNLRVAPPNGTCSTPVEFPANGGTLQLGLNGNSTNSASCGGTGGDKVHRWVAPRSGSTTVTLVPDFWPSTLYVRAGSCTGTEIACDNKTAQWPTNQVTFNATAGVEYFIWVSYGTYNGPVVSIYDLTVVAP
ncbi:MAG: choice-of-anchor D domain-containing protein [Myxococcota bacterium]